ncbi:hypothetical protein ACVWXL_002631 [Bradyrhizobium sp. GM22.5]
MTWRTVAKSRLSWASSSASAPLWNAFARKVPPRPQHIAGERGSGFDQADDAKLVGLAMTGGVGSHVGHHDVGAAVEHGLELVRRVIVHEVELCELDPGNLGDFQ